MATLTNREILFIVRMRNEARQMLRDLGSDWRSVAREAGRYAAAQRVSTDEINKVKTAAKEATAEINRLNAAMAKGKGWNGGPGQGGGGGGPGGPGKPPVVPRPPRVPPAPTGFYDSLKDATKHMLGFVGALAAMEAGVRGIEQYFEHVTEYTNLQGKIGLVATPGNQKGVSDRLFQVAMQTHQDIESVGEAYYKGKGALGKFGYSDNQIIALSKVINEANLVSHASPQAAKYGTYELMQGIGAGTLNGRELRFVAQDSIRLAQALGDGISQVAPDLAKKFGHVVKDGAKKGLYEITPGDLKGLTEKKLLTGDLVAKALLSQQDKLDGEAGQIPLTIPRVKNDIGTSLTKTLGEFDADNGISEAVVKSLEYLATTVIPMLKSGLQPVADAIHIVFAGFQLVGGVAGTLFGMLTQALPFLVPLLNSLAIGATAGGVAFGIMALAAAGLDVALELAAKGVEALTVAMDANPILVWAAVIAGAIALFEMFKDVQVSFGGESASIGAIVSSVWEHTLTFISSLWTDLMGVVKTVADFFVKVWSAVAPVVGGAFTWIMQKAGELWSWISTALSTYVPGLVRGLLSLPEAIGNIIAAYLTTFAKFVKGTLNLAADGVGVFNKGLADQIRAAGGTVEGVANSVAGGIKAGMALGAKFNPIVMMGGAAVAAAKYLGKKAGDAYKGTWSDAVAKTKAGPKKHQTFGAGDLDASNQELDPDSEAEKKKKKGRQGPDWEKQAADGIKALTTAYEPWMAQQVTNAQDMQRVNDLLDIQKNHQKEFAAALDRSGLTLAQFNQLVYAVGTGLDDKHLKDFFQSYIVGWKDTSAEEAKNADLARTHKLLMDARTKALQEGGKALADYEERLKHYGTTDAGVLQADKLFNLHIDPKDLDPSKVQSLVKTFLTAREQLDQGVADNTSQENVERTRKAAQTLLGVDPITMLQVANEAGVTLKSLHQALENAAAGISDKGVSEQSSKISALVSAYSPYLQKRQEEAERLREVNDQEQRLQANDQNLLKALAEKGISTDEYAAALRRTRLALTDQMDFTGQAKAAADRYIQTTAANGMTWGKAWDDVFKGAEDTLTTFIKTGKLDFSGLIDSMLADLARLEAEQVLMSAVSSVFGVAMPTGMTNIFAKHHIGGLVGGAMTGASSISPTVFTGARRYHSGGLVGQSLKSGEVPIIAKQNEAVLPTTRLPDGNFGVRALMPDSGSGGGAAPYIHFNPVLQITPPESASNPKDYGETLAASLTPALRRMVQEELVNQSRSGGLLNQRR